jgi:hypothetical protein
MNTDNFAATYPFASLESSAIVRPAAKVQKRRAITIFPIEMAIERGFATKPVHRWTINRDMIDFGKSFAVFFTAAMVYFA